MDFLKNPKNIRKQIVAIFALFSVLYLNIYYRSFPIHFPQFKTKAKEIVKQRIYSTAGKEVNNKFFNFSHYAKINLLNSLVADYKKNKKNDIEKQEKEEYLRLKDRYQDKYGRTYLMELDCWHWARYVDNVYRTGRPGDIVAGGKQIDTLMKAPIGSEMSWNNFLFYFSSFLLRIVHSFADIPLYTFLFYLPLFFIFLFLLALYFWCLRYCGVLAAFISCLFVGMGPIFLPRSCAGWFDMDILNLLFPLLAAISYLEVYQVADLRKKTWWLILSSFWVGLFCFTWNHWWFIVLIIISYEIYSLIDLLSAKIQYKEDIAVELKKHLFSLSLFLPFMLLWVILFSGLKPLEALFSQVKTAITLNDPLTISIWPNTFSTVGELKKADFVLISNAVGGHFFFLLCMIFMLFVLWNNKRYSGAKRESIFFFIMWFFITFLACFKGIRFAMFLLLPLGIFFGWGLEEVFRFFKTRNNKLILLASLFFSVILIDKLTSNGYKTAKSIFPLMDDTWYSALTTLKKNTPQGAVINSWWDFGDWFKAVSNRKVIFDGQTQDLPQAYWMAQVLLTDNEKEALGILRMLNNGGNRAFEIINGQIKDPFQSLFLIKKTILLEPDKGRGELTGVLPSPLADQVAKILYDKPPRAYFVVDSSMLSKMSAISYLGNWDFVKVYLVQNINKKIKYQIVDYLAKLGIDNAKAENLYQEARLISPSYINDWISRRQFFYSVSIPGKPKDGIILFDNGYVYNPKEKTFYAYFPQDGKYKIPKKLYIGKGDQLDEISFPNYEFDSEVMVIERPMGYELTVLSADLAKSLFVRMHFLEGRGLKFFEPFTKEKDTEESITVFKIDWD